MHVSFCNGVNYTSDDKQPPAFQAVSELEQQTFYVAAAAIEAESEGKQGPFATLHLDVLTLVFSHLPKENLAHLLVSRHWYRAAVALNDIYKNIFKEHFPFSCGLVEQYMATLPKGVTFWRDALKPEYAYSLKFCRSLDVPQSERKEILREELGFTRFIQEFLNDSLMVDNLNESGQSASLPGSKTEPFIYFNCNELNHDRFIYFETEAMPDAVFTYLDSSPLVLFKYHEKLTKDKIHTVASDIADAVVDKNPHALRKVLSENRLLARKLLDFFFGVFFHRSDKRCQSYRYSMGSFLFPHPKDAPSNGDTRDIADILWELLSEKINHTHGSVVREKIERAVITNQPEHVLKTLGSWQTVADAASDLAVNIGNLDLVRLLEDRAPNFIQTLKDECPSSAIANGMSEALIYLFVKYYPQLYHSSDLFREALISGNIQMLKFIIAKDAEESVGDFSSEGDGYFGWFSRMETLFNPDPFPHVNGEVMFEHTETAKFLIESGLVDPKGTDDSEVPFLYYALKTANLKSVQLLLNLGANFSKFSLVHYEELLRVYCEDESPYYTKKAAVCFLLNKIESLCSLEEMVLITLRAFTTTDENVIYTETFFSASNLFCENIVKRVYAATTFSDLLNQHLKELYQVKFDSYSTQSISTLTVEPDLLLLLAIITQQPLAKISKLLDSGASISGMGAHIPSPYSFAEKFHPEAKEFLLGRLANSLEKQMMPEYFSPMGYFPTTEKSEEIPEFDMFPAL